MNAHDRPEVPEEGRADLSELADAPYSVVCDVTDLDMARRLIEDLEEHDIPAHSIELVGAATKEAPDPDAGSAVADSRAFWALSRSTIAGGLVGLVIGALLGVSMAGLISGLSWPWGLVMGAVFGAGVGLAAGGMSIAKYSSPAWDETHEVEEADDLRVGVHHANVDVIDTAEMVMGRHTSGRINRMGTGERP